MTGIDWLSVAILAGLALYALVGLVARVRDYRRGDL